MPGTWKPPTLVSVIGNHARRIRALESQQQSVISNSKGLPIVNFGRIPGSNPSEYGIQFVNPISTFPVALLGEDGAGNVALTYYGPTGAVQSKYDENGLHFYNASGTEQIRVDTEGLHAYDASSKEVTRTDAAGLHVYNDAGTEMVAAGLVDSSPSPYGLAVLPQSGSLVQRVGGMVYALPSDAPNVTNTTFTAFAGSSSFSIEIGEYGGAPVTVQCSVATGGASQTGKVGVQVDGGAWREFIAVQVSVAGGIFATLGTTYPWTGLSPGAHTFTIGYSTFNNGTSTVSFSSPVLTVQPL